MIDPSRDVTLLCGDVIDALREIPSESVDAVVTDPPYAMQMGGGTKGWDDYGPRAFQRWTEQWAAEALRVAKPGAWIVSFGARRTWHRMGAGLEDGGWQIMDSIQWLFPVAFNRTVDLESRLTKNGSPDAVETVKGRVTQLMNRSEPAIVARKKLDTSLLHTIATHGTATFGSAECRAPGGGPPTNLVLVHDSECGDECLPGCPVGELGEQALLYPTFRYCVKPAAAERPSYEEAEPGKGTGQLASIGDVLRWRCDVCGIVTHSYLRNGGHYKSVPHRLCDHDSYVPLKINDFVTKVSHNTVKPLDLMRWLIRLTSKPGDVVLDCFAGSGSTLEAAVMEKRRAIGVERDPQSQELCRVRLRRSGCGRDVSDVGSERSTVDARSG